MGLIIAAGIALGTVGCGLYLDYKSKGDVLLVSLILALIMFNGYLAYSSVTSFKLRKISAMRVTNAAHDAEENKNHDGQCD